MSGMDMRLLGVLAAGAIAGSAAHGAFITTSVYDENTTQANAVDASATTLTVGAFTTQVSTAYAAGRGGVVDFGTGTLTSGNIDAGFAPSAGPGTETKTLPITLTTTTGATLAAGTLAPISNGNTSNILKAPGGGDVTFTFGTVTGAPTEKVTTFAFTLLTQTVLSGVQYTATVNYDDLTSTQTQKTIGRDTANPTLDNFWGFTAPTGRYITSVVFDTNAASNRDVTHIDDLAFITSVVPEPAALSLLATAGLFVSRRRRIA